jgi:small subunit ribosomal protein S14
MERRNLKDANKRAHFARIEEKRVVLRALIRDRSIHESVRYSAIMMLDRLPRHSAKGRIHNRCVSSGRSKGVYRQFKMSRICLRELMGMGALPGLKKASW